eukprot:TRINITY_DN44892_c0_g2_i1.p1 TRINITY_DN44892_c0_g2~~TRINITY_DN44892_c0_g2_i1.p1  ORF type:complete len:270 (+),score=23.96 TRINITY_DN44892_c0_g2_i1:85-810(+)
MGGDRDSHGGRAGLDRESHSARMAGERETLSGRAVEKEGHSGRIVAGERESHSGRVTVEKELEPPSSGVKKAVVENKLLCSLEELYSGSTRKMKISRNFIDASGKVTPADEIVTISVKPGWKKGTRITFPGKGNAADIVFVVDEKPHDVYKRDGHDLVCTQKITLVQALVDYRLELKTLDGRTLVVVLNDVITPGYEKVIPKEGMPVKENGRKGNLKIRFDIRFPSKLTPEQKTGLSQLFP